MFANLVKEVLIPRRRKGDTAGEQSRLGSPDEDAPTSTIWPVARLNRRDAF